MYRLKENGMNVPAYIWQEKGAIERGAIEQLEKVASLPFAFHHVVLCPDGHQGYGMPIGGVVATKDVVSPNMVGVDIGCFSGDTKIPLLDGKDYEIGDLVDKKDLYVYSCTDSSKIVVRKAVARKTRRNAKLVGVVLDNGEMVRCTPDHLFMTRPGGFDRADRLKKGDSLMPLYKRADDDGYVTIMQPYSGWYQRAHWIVGRSGVIGNPPKGVGKIVIHHKDFAKDNNAPDNLEFMTISKHSSYHAKLAGFPNESEKFQEKRMEGMRRRKKDPKKLEQMRVVGTSNIVNYMENNEEEYKKSIEENGRRGSKYLKRYNKSKKGRQKSSEIAKIEHECDVCGEICIGGFGLHNHKQSCHPVESKCPKCSRVFKSERAVATHLRYCNNHRVEDVVDLSEKEDVYCLMIINEEYQEEVHNFAISSGVFVHNCGMCAVKSNVKEISEKHLKGILEQIRNRIPVGFNHHQDSHEDRMPEADSVMGFDSVVMREYDSACHQIGTLGGGNHFIEIQKDEEGYIWVMIHSGSRNLGFQVAKHYNDLAKKLNARWHSEVPKEHDLAFLPMESQEAQNYLAEMNYCLDFALANRSFMLEVIQDIIASFTGCEFGEVVNIHHNYVAPERHFGQNVMVHRKGATSARAGEPGIIPGSQGTFSYIVRGKGNRESFSSCSHGAGRKMGRKDAKRRLDLADEQKKLDDQGILHSIRTEADLDEAAGAYKDIDVVMDEQRDLVDIVVKLSPVAVVKG